MSTTVMRITAGLLLLGYLDGIGAQPPLETGPAEQLSGDCLYRTGADVVVEERRRLMRRWSQLLRTRLVELSEISGK